MIPTRGLGFKPLCTRETRYTALLPSIADIIRNSTAAKLRNLTDEGFRDSEDILNRTGTVVPKLWIDGGHPMGH